MYDRLIILVANNHLQEVLQQLIVYFLGLGNIGIRR